MPDELAPDYRALCYAMGWPPIAGGSPEGDKPAPQDTPPPDAPAAEPEGTREPEAPDASTSDDTDRESQAWAAGLFEGEGCVHLAKNKTGQCYVHLTLVTTDQDVLEHFAQVVGTGRTYAKKPKEPHHKDQWQWFCTRRNEVARTQAMLMPYLGQRRTERWLECNSLATAPIRSGKTS